MQRLSLTMWPIGGARVKHECVHVCVDSRLRLWRSLCRYWAGHSPAGLSAEWRSAWLQGYQSPSRSPGWPTAGRSPGCAGQTHRYGAGQQRYCSRGHNLSPQQTFAQLQGLLRHAGTFSPSLSRLKCYLLSVQLLNLLLMSPQDFIQLTHPAEFSLAGKKKRGVALNFPSFHVKMSIKWRRTYVDVHFFWQTRVDIFPVVIWSQLWGGKMQMNTETFRECAPTLESGALMQCHKQRRSYFRKSDKDGKAAPPHTEPGAMCLLTKQASDCFFFLILENQVKEYKSIRLTRVQSQLRRCAQQLFCLEPTDPRLAVVSWTCTAFTIMAKYHSSDGTANFRVIILHHQIANMSRLRCTQAAHC